MVRDRAPRVVSWPSSCPRIGTGCRPSFVADAVDAIFRALTRGSGLLLHVSTGEQTGLRSILQTIGIETVVSEKVAGRTIGRMALSPARARLHLGWVPWTGLAEGIASTITAND
jgi:UDP-glucose 4-epimerase